MRSSDADPVYSRVLLYVDISDIGWQGESDHAAGNLSVDEDLAFFHVLTTAILHILPDKRYEQYVRLFMGLLLILLIWHACFCCCRKKSGTSGGIPEKLQPGRTGADGSGSAGDPGNLSEGSLRK